MSTEHLIEALRAELRRATYRGDEQHTADVRARLDELTGTRTAAAAPAAERAVRKPARAATPTA